MANGVKNLVVQPTHLMHGAEYDEMMDVINRYEDQFATVQVAEPLLGEVGSDAAVINEDKQAVAEAVTAAAVADAGYDSLDAAKGRRYGFRVPGTWYVSHGKSILQPDADTDDQAGV